jgi:hypothetical protein
VERQEPHVEKAAAREGIGCFHVEDFGNVPLVEVRGPEVAPDELGIGADVVDVRGCLSLASRT